MPPSSSRDTLAPSLIRYKQKTRQHKLHMLLMGRCLTRSIGVTVRKKKNKVQYVGTVRFKDGTEVRYAGTIPKQGT